MQNMDARLTRGRKYKIIFQLGTQRFPRRSVMTYLGESRMPGECDWNARPVAGTQSLPWSSIIKIYAVSQHADVVLNEDARR